MSYDDGARRYVHVVKLSRWSLVCRDNWNEWVTTLGCDRLGVPLKWEFLSGGGRMLVTSDLQEHCRVHLTAAGVVLDGNRLFDETLRWWHVVVEDEFWVAFRKTFKRTTRGQNVRYNPHHVRIQI